jgi:hypothetical protein
MALPDSWLDHLFGRLAVRYGDAWLRKWDGVQMSAVRADWAQVLDGVNGDAIAYGLQYLPAEYPPTAAAFKALCSGHRGQNTLLLPLPEVEVNHAAVAKLRAKVDEFADAANVRAREREAKERQSRPRTVVVPPERQWAPQGPLPWPRGVPKADSGDQRA